MSKKVKKPFFIIAFFIVGLVLGFYLGFNKIVICIGFTLGLGLIATRKFGLFALSASFFMGIIYIQIFASSIVTAVAPGCYNGRIGSIPKESAEFLQAAFVAKDGARFILETDSEEINYTDRLSLCFDENKIRTIEGGYGKYLLSRYQSSTVVKNPDIQFLEKNQFWSSFFSFRDKIIGVARKIYIGDKGVLASGLILGGSQDFSESFKDNMKKSGTTHLVAVSGYNVSIITICLFGLVRSLFSRRAAVISSIAVLVGFCIITGASASVVRASVMGLVYIMSKVLGRKVPALHLLSVAAFFMILVNPFTIFDVGFQLSFVATLGLILSIDLFNYLGQNNIYKIILLLILQTAIAQVFTLPILIYNFKQASILSFLPNTLILPIIPLTMCFVAFAILAGFVNIYLALFVGLVGEFLLRYINFVIKYFGSLPFVSVKIDEFPLYGVFVSYAIIIFGVFLINKKINEKRLREDI